MQPRDIGPGSGVTSDEEIRKAAETRACACNDRICTVSAEPAITRIARYSTARPACPATPIMSVASTRAEGATAELSDIRDERKGLVIEALVMCEHHMIAKT